MAFRFKVGAELGNFARERSQNVRTPRCQNEIATKAPLRDATDRPKWPHEQSQRASDEEGATERKIHELKEDLDWTEDLLELVRQHLRENAPKVTRVV
jgi:hypothetical protein